MYGNGTQLLLCLSPIIVCYNDILLVYVKVVVIISQQFVVYDIKMTENVSMMHDFHEFVFML